MEESKFVISRFADRRPQLPPVTGERAAGCARASVRITNPGHPASH